MSSTAIDVLWTSGWDSTYRVADVVLNEKRTVQPWYILDSDRRSWRREISIQAEIRRAMMRKDPSAGGRLLPTKIHRLRDVPVHPEITDKWRTLAGQRHLGRQYDWLARFAHAQGVKLELSIHRDDKAQVFLEGSVFRDDMGVYHLKEGVTGPLTLFKDLSYPLFDLSKVDMETEARAAGFGDIMEMTWFCATPLLDGKPCGFCNPCLYTREEGMGRRIPERSRLHHAQFYFLMQKARIFGGVRTRVREVCARLRK